MSGRGLRRYVEDLLRHRRPRPFDASSEDVATLRAAITLRAARPGADVPSEEFVGRLHRRLVEEVNGGESARPELDGVAGGGGPAGSGPAGSGSFGDRSSGGASSGDRQRKTRRRFVQVTSLAAGSAAIGAGVDRAVVDRGSGSGERTNPPVAEQEPQGGSDGTGGTGGTLIPDTGSWQTVTTTEDLPEGGVHAFDAGTVVGFVQRVGGRVRGVSGVCTHQGCQLALDSAQRQLNCPCHRTAFALTGEVVHSKLRTPPRTLPRLAVREADGVVQVYVPPTPA